MNTVTMELYNLRTKHKIRGSHIIRSGTPATSATTTRSHLNAKGFHVLAHVFYANKSAYKKHEFFGLVVGFVLLYDEAHLSTVQQILLGYIFKKLALLKLLCRISVCPSVRLNSTVWGLGSVA
jgi:hypothetical protein